MQRILSWILTVILLLSSVSFPVYAEEAVDMPNEVFTEEVSTDIPSVESPPEATAEPTPEPTPEPTAEPTPEPTAEPTAEPIPEPTTESTPEPTVGPTAEPAVVPEKTDVLESESTPFIEGYVRISKGTTAYKTASRQEEAGTFHSASVVYAEVEREGNDFDSSWLKVTFDIEEARKENAAFGTAYVLGKSVSILEEMEAAGLINQLAQDGSTRKYQGNPMPVANFMVKTEAMEESATDPIIEPTTTPIAQEKSEELAAGSQKMFTMVRSVSLMDAVITKQPVNVTAAAGATAKLTVTATGAAKYQWQNSRDGKNWTNSSWSGYNTATVSVSVAVSHYDYQWRCVVTGESGNTVTTNAVKIVKPADAVITKQPVNVTAAVGTTIKLTVTATGAAKYQWQNSSDGKTWSNSSLTGYSTATLSVPVTSSRYDYQWRCVVTGESGNTVTTNAVKIENPAAIVTIPKVTTNPALAISSGSIASYQTSNGDLTISWNTTGGNDVYNVTAIIIDETPLFDDSTAANNQKNNAKLTILNNENFSGTSFTVTKVQMSKGKYLKVAIGAKDQNYATNGEVKWMVFGVEFVDAKPAEIPVVKNSVTGVTYTAKSTTEYNRNHGGFNLTYSSVNGSGKYHVTAIIINEEPLFDDSEYANNQKNSDQTVKILYDDDTTSTSLPFSLADLQLGSYLKVAVGAYSSSNTTGTADKWLVFGIKLINNQPVSVPTDTETNFAGRIWRELKGWGFTDIQAAGIMGNIAAESVYCPYNAQDSYGFPGVDNRKDYIFKVDDAVGFGLCQWTAKSRKSRLLNHAGSDSVWSFDVQMSYLHWELQNMYIGGKTFENYLKGLSTIKEVTEIFMTDFEAPANQSASAKAVRVQKAQAAYDTYAGSTDVKLTSISLNTSAQTIGIGGTNQNYLPTVTYAPSNATNKSVTWKSSNTTVATVNSSTGVVTGVAGGSATITATAADGSGKTASYTIYVVGTPVIKTGSTTVAAGATTTWNTANALTISWSGTSANRYLYKIITMNEKPTANQDQGANATVATIVNQTTASTTTSYTLTVAQLASYAKNAKYLKIWVQALNSNDAAHGPSAWIGVELGSTPTPEPYGDFNKTKITLTQGETATFTVSGGVENSTNFVYTVNGERPDGSGLSISSWSGITVSGKSTFSKTFTVDARSGGDFYTPGTYTLELWVRDASAHTSESMDTMTVVVQKAASEPVFTAKFANSTKTITLGERWLVEGSISVSGGSGYLGKVTINSDSVAGSSMTQDFTNHNFTNVDLEYWFVIDTTIAPWNTPGTYNLRVWAKDTDGTGGTAALANMILIIEEAANSSEVNSNQKKIVARAKRYLFSTSNKYEASGIYYYNSTKQVPDGWYAHGVPYCVKTGTEYCRNTLEKYLGFSLAKKQKQDDYVYEATGMKRSGPMYGLDCTGFCIDSWNALGDGFGFGYGFASTVSDVAYRRAFDPSLAQPGDVFAINTSSKKHVMIVAENNPSSKTVVILEQTANQGDYVYCECSGCDKNEVISLGSRIKTYTYSELSSYQYMYRHEDCMSSSDKNGWSAPGTW